MARTPNSPSDCSRTWEPWPAREVAVVLPIATAKAVFEPAERFDIERGGRFDRRSACVLIWSANAAAADSGEPVGGFWVRWHDPTEEQTMPSNHHRRTTGYEPLPDQGPTS